MINNSVVQAYNQIDSLTKSIDKIAKEGFPKAIKQQKRKDTKGGLLSRSDDMNRYNKPKEMKKDESIEQQKLVIGYILRIREAFEEVKNGRATNTKS
jgi:hypothetical protein